MPRSRSMVGLAVGLGYLVGTFPTASIVARRASGGSVDLRRAGTGNPGTANAMKVRGRKAGAAVMVGDVGKGALACALGASVAGPAGAHLAGTADMAGHCYPAWERSCGGDEVGRTSGVPHRAGCSRSRRR